MFEGATDHITLKPEKVHGSNAGESGYIDPKWPEKFGTESEVRVPVAQKDIMQVQVGNFLDCMRSRQKPTLDVETGAHAQVLITMAVHSYRQGKVLYFDEKTWKVSDKPAKA